MAFKDFANATYTIDTAAALIWLSQLSNNLSQAGADCIGHATKVTYSSYTKSLVNRNQHFKC